MSAAWDPYEIAGKEGWRFLRQSTMSTGDICLQRMGFDLNASIPRGTGEARIVGTSYHAGLEAYYTGRRDGDHVWLDERIAAARFAFDEEIMAHPDLVWATSEDEAWARVTDMLQAYGDHTANAWPSEYEVVGVEQEWFLPLPEPVGESLILPSERAGGSSPIHWGLKGQMDLLLRGKSGLVIDDHKTAGRKWPKGKESPHKSVQSPLYAWAVEQVLGERPYAFTFSVMTYKGEFDRRWTSITDAQVEAILRKARAYAHLLEAMPLDGLPTNPSSNLCSPLYCDHWHRCPSGADSAEVL